jgi:crossover junction endodeoxyribonuclease RuvC
MTLVLGIDPGTATTGYGLVRNRADSSLEAVAYGTIQTPAGIPAHERLSMLFHEINEILLLHRPDSCAVEKLFFQRNISTAIAVGQARGVLMLAISEAGLSMGEYTGRGRIWKRGKETGAGNGAGTPGITGNPQTG